MNVALTLAVIGCIAGSVSGLVVAAQPNLNVGIGAGIGSSEYKSYDTSFLPFPLIDYENDYLYLHGLSAGAFVYKDTIRQLRLGVNLLPYQFDPANTDDTQLQQLEKRSYTMLYHLGFKQKLGFGELSTIFGVDALNRSNHGMMGIAEYRYPQRLSNSLMIIPMTGIEWHSANLNNYYYGISAEEASRSGLSLYIPEASVSPYAAVMINYRLTKRMALLLSAKYQHLPNTIRISPMVGKDYRLNSFIGATFSF